MLLQSFGFLISLCRFMEGSKKNSKLTVILSNLLTLSKFSSFFLCLLYSSSLYWVISIAWFLFLFMFHLQGFGVLLLLWIMSVKVESMNVVTKTRDICMYMAEIKRCNWAEKSLEDALNCSLTSLGGRYYACNSLSNSHLSTLLHVCLTNMGIMDSFKLDVWVDCL